MVAAEALRCRLGTVVVWLAAAGRQQLGSCDSAVAVVVAHQATAAAAAAAWRQWDGVDGGSGSLAAARWLLLA